MLTSLVFASPLKLTIAVSYELGAHSRATESRGQKGTLNAPWGNWTHYHSYTEILDTLLYLNATYPHIVDVFSIGESWEGRDILCIRLTNESVMDFKPELLFVGYHHAREPISAELPLYFAVKAASSFGTNVTLTRLVNSTELYIVPALNVDGFTAVMQNDWQRKNTHSYDEDSDGSLDEDPPEDGDGDGYVEGLWQWNGYEYVFLKWEGVDNDVDGKFGEDWIGGVDLNRNYSYEWNASVSSGSPYPRDEDYRGPAPFSEPETQALRDFTLQHKFLYATSFHSGAENIIYPWGYTQTPTPADSIFTEIGIDLSALTGAPSYQSGQWYTTSGVWDDWMYGNRSTYAFTCELYSNNSAWQYEAGPYPDSWWERGILQVFNPDPKSIETVVQRWLPVFSYTASRAIVNAHDLAATGIASSRTIVGQGYDVSINVTVTNQGDFAEFLNVTAFAGSSPIAMQTVTLAERQASTLTFTWNTTGYPKGSYIVSAQAEAVEGETRTRNNVISYGEIFVTIPGDVNGDKDVDIFDIVSMASLYGQTLPPIWPVPPPDIDGDADVDIFDIVIAAANYRKQW